VALSEIDRTLLERCLARKPKAWEDFVDRFMGLVVHVTNHTAQSRSVRLTPEDREDLASEVLLTIVNDDFAVLRHFRGQASLATYLTVIARRVVVRSVLERKAAARLTPGTSPLESSDGAVPVEQRVSDREQIARLLEGLDGEEADIVRMYHLDEKSYQEISAAIGIPENSIGPTLSRAREKMRRAAAEQSQP
jgi:RNA polymerase sigma-70 factor (ECF subfamily)